MTGSLSIVLLALVAKAMADCPAPEGTVASLVAAVQEIGSTSQNVADKVNDFQVSSGIFGALAIQTAEAKIETAVSQAVTLANKLASPASSCDSQAIIAATQQSLAGITNCLAALSNRKADLAGVGVTKIVQNDLESLISKTYGLETATYSKMVCPDVAEMKTLFKEINSAFSEAFETWELSLSAAPVAPQCDVISSVVVPSAPASSAPASSTPASSTPASSAPISSVVVPSAPASSAPASSAPASSAPATPASSAPATSAPVPSAPATSAPVPSAPATSAPVPSAPATSAPISSAPVPSGTDECSTKSLDCAGHSATGAFASVVTALSAVASDTADTADLVNKFEASQGINAALQIQVNYGVIEKDVKAALAAASSIPTPVGDCDAQVIANAIQSSAPSIVSILKALKEKSADLIEVGTKQIVQNDLIQLGALTEQLESVAYSKTPCDFVGQAAASFKEINDAFADANAAYDNPVQKFPSAPSDCPVPTCAPASSGGVPSGPSRTHATQMSTTITVTEGTKTVTIGCGCETKSGSLVCSGQNSGTSTTVTVSCSRCTGNGADTQETGKTKITVTDGGSMATIGCECTKTTLSGAPHSICTGKHSGKATIVTLPCPSSIMHPETTTTHAVTVIETITRTASNGQTYVTTVPVGGPKPPGASTGFGPSGNEQSNSGRKKHFYGPAMMIGMFLAMTV